MREGTPKVKESEATPRISKFILIHALSHEGRI